MVPDPRTSSRSATRGTTSLADFPGCAKSPSLIPCSGVESRVRERRHVVNNTLGRQRAHGLADDEYREYGEDRLRGRREQP